MRRAVALIAITVVTGGLALAACAQESATAASETMTVTVSEADATTFEMVDQGKKGFGPGDMLVENAPTMDDAGEVTGNTLTTVTVIDGKEMTDFNGTIDCTVQLADGHLIFAGGFAMSDMATGATVAVTGGTGAYKGATGTVTMTMPDETKTVLNFDYTLP